MTDLAKNIKRLRTEKNMTQADLADILHVTRQTVSSWERGNSTPDLSLLPTIAEALETDVTGLLYPSAPKTKTVTVGPAFVLWSTILYFVNLIDMFGIGHFLLGFLGDDFLVSNWFLLVWGLTLLVVFISICTALILEAIANK